MIPQRMFVFLVAVVLLTGACTVRERQSGFGFKESISSQSEITFDGWVRWVEFGQGRETARGYWRLLSEEGYPFDPVSMPLEFQHDGLAIHATVTPLPTVGNEGLWQTPVYIKSIRKR
jgi:hypothetical protein